MGVLRPALTAYRRTGADLPFSDPARAHGTALEGYYWRIVQGASQQVLVCLCGVCRTDTESWAVVACAAHPGGFVHHVVLSPAAADPHGFGAEAGGMFMGSTQGLRVSLASEVWVDVRLRPRTVWPRQAFGALGAAHALPSLGQYWHPVLLSADVEGEASLGGTHMRLDGATAYAEKNWGPGFAGRWWWGHADAFPSGQAAVAFAGGRARLLGSSVSPTALVVRLGTEILRFAPPLARSSAAVGADEWRIRCRSPRYSIEIEGRGRMGAAHALPVPDVATRRVEMRSSQHLAGSVRMGVRRAGRLLMDETSSLAGLELGVPAAEYPRS